MNTYAGEANKGENPEVVFDAGCQKGGGARVPSGVDGRIPVLRLLLATRTPQGLLRPGRRMSSYPSAGWLRDN